MQDEGGGRLHKGAVTMIWRAAFDLLPTKEPAGNGPARWKVQRRGGEWWIYERQENADEIKMTLPFVVDASMVKTWIAPLLRKAMQEGDEKTVPAIVVVQDALDAADEGFKAFERELDPLGEHRG